MRRRRLWRVYVNLGKSKSMPGPMHGFRIIDLTSMLSGPWATMILADQGADVVKVEMPGSGDHTRSLANQRGNMSANFLNINRNKRSITINLKTERGRELLEALAKTADALVQNFRPGVVDRLGIGEGRLRKVAPKLLYVSISGFGDRGPWAGKPVYDPVIQAMSGLTTVQAGSDAQRPRLVRTVVPDKVSALTAAQAITAGLLARERTGEGQHLRMSMLDAVMAFLWASDMGAQTYMDAQVTDQEAASFIDLIYETKDGFMTVAVMTNKEWQGLARALDHPEWLGDPRFGSPAARDRYVNERLAMTQEVLRTGTTALWMERLEEHDVPCAPALTRNEVLNHPQIIASGTLIELDHPASGRLRQARPPARFERTPAGLRFGAPRLGEHTDEILLEIGYTSAQIEVLRAAAVIGEK
jgi:crotonobetainyl-CoA:carnitine CoA-transferase CaiB-like acyl-CoA transferase